MNVLFCAYRSWALDSLDLIISDHSQLATNCNYLVAKNQEEFNSYQNLNLNLDLAFFVGWSWKIPQRFLEKNLSICFHPSPLPKYRGGSPIQHQIINGEKKSCGTFFKMTRDLDAGPIVWQKEYSLEGELGEVFSRLTPLVAEGVKFILENFESLIYVAQIESDRTFFSRRTPEMSEITIEDFKNMTALELHNKIRALQDPYPNAFIVTKDGSKLFILKSRIK